MIIVVMIIVLIVLVGVYFCLNSNSSSDAMRFKEEYESLNGTVRESDGALYNDVNIGKDNVIKYISVKDAVNIIENSSGIIFLGASWCPWCREAAPVLLESAKNNKLDTVYYVDMDVARDTWEVIDGELVKTYDGEEGYSELLEVLDSILEDYVVVDDEGNQYDTYEKRVYIPLVVAVNDGKIVDSHLGTVNLNEGQTKHDKLTDSQHDSLLDIYDNMIENINSDYCSSDENC